MAKSADRSRQKLLRSADRAACRTKRNRSIVQREALDREGYLKNPQSPAEAQLWEAEAAWPDE